MTTRRRIEALYDRRCRYQTPVKMDGMPEEVQDVSILDLEEGFMLGISETVLTEGSKNLSADEHSIQRSNITPQKKRDPVGIVSVY